MITVKNFNNDMDSDSVFFRTNEEKLFYPDFPVRLAIFSVF